MRRQRAACECLKAPWLLSQLPGTIAPLGWPKERHCLPGIARVPTLLKFQERRTTRGHKEVFSLCLFVLRLHLFEAPTGAVYPYFSMRCVGHKLVTHGASASKPKGMPCRKQRARPSARTGSNNPSVLEPGSETVLRTLWEPPRTFAKNVC